MNDPVLTSPMYIEKPVEQPDAISSIDYYNSKKAAMILRAINHKLRQHLIEIIRENKKLTVTELYIKMRIEQSVASQHLGILRRAGIVSTVRDGKFVYYTINSGRLETISKYVNELLK